MRKIVDRIIVGGILLLILVALLGDVSLAASDGGRTAADFLQIGSSARSAGMAGAYTAVASDADAAYWNPAALIRSDRPGVSLSHFSWYQDVTYDHGTISLPVRDRFNVAASFTYLGYGDIEGFTAANEPTGGLDASDWAGSVSLGFAATDMLSLGVTGKYVTQKLDDVSAAGFAVDLGLLMQFERVSVGAALTNVGSDLEFESTKEKLPSALRLGVAAQPFGNGWQASLEWESRRYGSSILRNGFEIGFQDRYFVRSGYRVFLDGGEQSLSDGLSFGFGLVFRQASLDYAYSLADQFSSDDVHRFSLSLWL